MSIEALEGLTDQDLFNEANADEAPVETVAESPEPEQLEQHRDDAGRFAAQAAEEPAPTVTEQSAPPPVDDNAAMVPSWRVREIREQRDATAERLKALEAERSQWQQRQAQPPQPAAPKVAKPDPLLDPDGYEAYLENKVEEKLLNNDRESSMAQAHRAYKGEFEEAMAEATRKVDPALKALMQNSRDPGETLIQWHREQKTRAEVGTDPNAYFDKRLEAFLADPANQAKMLERIRGGVQPQQPGTPKQAAPVNLPPSLTRAASAATVTADDDDISDDGLWRHANA